jgi:DNA-binding beta-propeller fold protein YncE
MLLRLLPLLAAASLSAASVSTFAGNGQKGYSGDGGPATSATMNDPFGVIRGPDGAIWYCEYGGQRIRRVDKDGKITLVAGNGQTGYSGDGGPATAATFNLPHELRFGPKRGNLFIVDMQNHAVRKIDTKTGIITTVVGTGKPGYSGDGGQADQAQLKQPHSIQFDANGDLFICDIGNNVIRKVDMKTKVITTIAGTGKPGITPDGAPIKGTPLKGPRSIDFDAAGNLWVCTREGNQVFKLDLKADKITHVAGNGKKGFTGNGGPAKLATLSGPKGVAIDAEGNAWLVDTESHSIRMVNAKTGNLELVIGTGQKHDGPDGDPLKCGLARPHGIWVDKDGTVFVGDSENHRVRVWKK